MILKSCCSWDYTWQYYYLVISFILLIALCASIDVIRNVAECKNSHVDERDLLNILPKFKLHRDNLPALHPTWKWVANL